MLWIVLGLAGLLSIGITYCCCIVASKCDDAEEEMWYKES